MEKDDPLWQPLSSKTETNKMGKKNTKSEIESSSKQLTNASSRFGTDLLSPLFETG